VKTRGNLGLFGLVGFRKVCTIIFVTGKNLGCNFEEKTPKTG
jgi:hypothetical protein